MTSFVKFLKKFEKFRCSPLGVVMNEICRQNLSHLHKHLICCESTSSHDQILMFLSKTVILTAQIRNHHKNRLVQQNAITFTFVNSAQKMLSNDILDAIYQVKFNIDGFRSYRKILSDPNSLVT